MQYSIKEEGKFKYIEEGEGETLDAVAWIVWRIEQFQRPDRTFRHTNKVVVPMLPLFELDILHTTVGGFAKYVHKFIELKGYKNIHLLGNSLGGHVALVHVLKHPEKIKSLILPAVPGFLKMEWVIPIRGEAIMNTSKKKRK